MTRPIRTQDLELAAAFMVLTGEQPGLVLEAGSKLITFEIPAGDGTVSLLNDYATGNLNLNIKRFVSCRNYLFKRLKGVHRD